VRAGSSPANTLMNVLLPEPFGPMTVKMQPFSTATDTFEMMSSPPYPAATPSVLRTISRAFTALPWAFTEAPPDRRRRRADPPRSA